MLVRALLSALVVSFAGLVTAQSQTIVNPTTAAPSATTVANANGYSYVGCWNETVDIPNAGGVRALGQNGNFVSIRTHSGLRHGLTPGIVRE